MPRRKTRKIKIALPQNLPRPKLTPFNIILSILIFTAIGAIFGSVTTFIIMQNQSAIWQTKSVQKSQNDFIKEFYEVENAVHVSPHSVRKSMDEGQLDVTLVDLRSPQEYEASHIIGAINIPAYTDPNTSA